MAGRGRASPGGSRPGSPNATAKEVVAIPNTNITEDHRRAFEALTSGRFDNFCLVSCFVDGEATAAIATVNVSPPAEDGGEPDYIITPLFVCPTAAMTLTDHDAREA